MLCDKENIETGARMCGLCEFIQGINLLQLELTKCKKTFPFRARQEKEINSFHIQAEINSEKRNGNTQKNYVNRKQLK